MKFVIRDDDTCAMTRPDELETCYSRVWDDVPVCLSVTPFRIPHDALGVPAELLGSLEPIPLEENRAIVGLLRDGIARGRIHVAMHGYHHDRPGGRPEYVAGNDLARKTLHGRRYLEELLDCRISTFVPPNNTLSKEGFEAVVGAGLNIVSNQNYARLRFPAASPSAVIDLLLSAQYSLRNRLGRANAFHKRVYMRYQQLPYQTAGPSVDPHELRRALAACERANGVFVLATHYHAFDRRTPGGETVGDTVYRLIDEAHESGDTEFVTYDACW